MLALFILGFVSGCAVVAVKRFHRVSNDALLRVFNNL